MENSFLPNSYQIPEKGGEFLKWQQGDNTFRVLDHAIVGWETWVVVEGGGKKPVRTDMNSSAEEESKHFWAFPCYSYNNKRIQIVIVTQVGIMRSITSLANNPKWGSPTGYNLVVNKSGEGLETEYSVNPEPKPAKGDEEFELIEKIKAEFKNMHVDMNVLYSSKENPYGGYPISDRKKDNSASVERLF